ncbi:MAG: sensor histidine kinase [Pseudobdellovibrio sp.]
MAKRFYYILAVIIVMLGTIPTVIFYEKSQEFMSETVKQLENEIAGCEALERVKYDSRFDDHLMSLNQWLMINEDIQENYGIILDLLAESYYLGQLVTIDLPQLIKELFVVKKKKSEVLRIDKKLDDDLYNLLNKIAYRLLRAQTSIAKSSYLEGKRFNYEKKWFEITTSIEEKTVGTRQESYKKIESSLLDFRLELLADLKTILNSRLEYNNLKLKRMINALAGTAMLSVVCGLLLIFLLIERIKKTTEEVVRKNEMLIKTSKLALLGELSSGIGHEINNPMTVLSSSIQKLKKLSQSSEAPPQDELRNIADKSGLAIQRVTAIIKSMRTMILGNYEENIIQFEIKPVIDEVLVLLNHLIKKYKIDLDIQGLNNNYVVLGLPIETGQIFTNLIKNAIDAIKNEVERKIFIKFELSNRCLCIYVSDSGTGVNPENKNKIFDGFYTTKINEGGTGIGLSYSKKIAEKMNGQLELLENSYILKGACFKFTLHLP